MCSQAPFYFFFLSSILLGVNLLVMENAKQKLDFFFAFSAMRGEILEFSDICKKYLGKPGELLAILFSLAATAGAAIVFWVLMSNFLYNSGKYIHGEILLPLHIHTCAFIYDQHGSI